MGQKIDFPTKAPAYYALERIAYELGELVEEGVGVNGEIIRAVASPIEGAIKAGIKTLRQWKRHDRVLRVAFHAFEVPATPYF